MMFKLDYTKLIQVNILCSDKIKIVRPKEEEGNQVGNKGGCRTNKKLKYSLSQNTVGSHHDNYTFELLTFEIIIIMESFQKSQSLQ